MVRRWDRWRNPWDREYAKRGRLWRGRANLDPLPEVAPPPRNVLEVGCGDGKFLSALGEGSYTWVGLDFSQRALKLAPDGPRVLGDARSLPFRDGSFPVVVARYAVGALSMSDRTTAVAELARVCAPDGQILIEEFSVEDFRHGKGTPVEHGTFERNQGILTHYFTEPEMRGLIPGFTAKRVDVVRGRLRIMGSTQGRVALRGVYSR